MVRQAAAIPCQGAPVAVDYSGWKEVKRMVKRPEYEAPKLVTYHEDDILEELGPAQACTSPCPVP
jgi:hypothetical protein